MAEDDPFTRPLQPSLSEALMKLMTEVPAAWAAEAEGREGPVDVPG